MPASIFEFHIQRQSAFFKLTDQTSYFDPRPLMANDFLVEKLKLS